MRIRRKKPADKSGDVLKALEDISGAKRPKMKNRKIEIDGKKFDSAAEGRRYQELKLEQFCGDITELTTQYRITLQPGFRGSDGKWIRPIDYVADFSYRRDGVWILEDHKGFKTKDYLLKMKMILFKIHVGDFTFSFLETKVERKPAK